MALNKNSSTFEIYTAFLAKLDSADWDELAHMQITLEKDLSKKRSSLSEPEQVIFEETIEMIEIAKADHVPFYKDMNYPARLRVLFEKISEIKA